MRTFEHETLGKLMNDHLKTTPVVVTCVLAWAITLAVNTRPGQRILGAAIRAAFELLDGADMLVGIG
jgi:hypothetical protein